MTFKELQLSESVLRALIEKQYSTPTPIQVKAIPIALKGSDLVGIAQTGTGKTAAFAIPIIEHLKQEHYAKDSKREIKALILTPTRELAIQISETFTDYGKYTGLKHTVIFGGVNQNPQVRTLNQGVDILIATPGRLLDLISQKVISLSHITHFVLDEADRMLDMGFIHDIRRLLPMLPTKRQTMLFSATMPKVIADLSKTILHQPTRVEVAPAASVVDTIQQLFYFVDRKRKIDLLYTLIMEYKESSILIFSRTKHGADKISRTLGKRGIKCEAIHGNKSQNARQTALNNFKSGKSNIIVATDIAARGIDIQNLGLVINYDMPDVAETYVHRIGRTGRAGNSGLALSFCTEEEKQMFKSIQKLTGRTIPAKKVNFETEGSRVESVPEESIDNLQNNNKKAPSKGKSGRETDQRGSRGKENKEGRGEQRGGAQKRGKKKSEETSDRNLNGEERVSKVANRGSERAPKESNAIEETQRPAKKWNKFKAERERQRMANRAANYKKRNKFSRSDSRNEKSTF